MALVGLVLEMERVDKFGIRDTAIFFWDYFRCQSNVICDADNGVRSSEFSLNLVAVYFIHSDRAGRVLVIDI